MKKNKTYSENVINAFLFGRSNKDISEMANISLRTVARYKQDAELKRLVIQRKNEIIRQEVLRMSALFGVCTDELEQIIKNPQTKPQIKINAINTLYSQCREWTATTEIIERLDRLEQLQNGT